MKKKIITILLTFILVLTLCVPVLAVSGVSGYDYVYSFTDAAGTPPAVQEEEDPDYFTYYPTSSIKDGSEYSTDGEYLVINTDGSGMSVYDGAAYSLKWTSDGANFSFTDNGGNKFTGKLTDNDTLEGDYHRYKYVFSSGENAPILSLSQETWNNGLPLVMDQAGILDENQEKNLNKEAERISEKYKCNVYIVTLDDMANFSFSDSIEVCAEEVRKGYSLGFGNDKNCIMLLLSMADRDLDLDANGDFANATFTDYGKGELKKSFRSEFQDDNWFAGFSNYLSKSEELLAMSVEGKPLDKGSKPVNPLLSLVMSLLCAFVAAFFICQAIKMKMKSVAEGTSAEEYFANGGMNIAYRYDKYTHTSTERIYDPHTKSSGGGGTSTSSSGESHSSGKF